MSNLLFYFLIFSFFYCQRFNPIWKLYWDDTARFKSLVCETGLMPRAWIPKKNTCGFFPKNPGGCFGFFYFGFYGFFKNIKFSLFYRFILVKPAQTGLAFWPARLYLVLGMTNHRKNQISKIYNFTSVNRN